MRMKGRDLFTFFMLWDGREMVNRLGTKRSFEVRSTTRGHLSLSVARPPSMQMTALVRLLVSQRRRDLGKCDFVFHALLSHAPMGDDPFLSSFFFSSVFCFESMIHFSLGVLKTSRIRVCFTKTMS